MDQYVGWDVSLKETSIVGSGPTATGFGASRVLVGPTTRRQNGKKPRALCRIGGVRDRAARDLVSSRTHRR